MLLDDDVVADREAKTGPFSSRLRCEERVEHLLLHFGRNTGAVVADPDLNTVAEVLGRGSKRRLVVASIRFCFALGRRIEAVGDQVQERPRDVLWEDISFAGGRPFTLVSVIIRESPVMLPPGRARSATWLLPSGSA
jgi:hypothetical protein